MLKNEKGSLFIVSTPIGNLGDITYRAVETLREVQLIAAEDTRRTRILLNHYDISTPLSSYNSYNQIKKGPVIIRNLLEGQNVALVSDAGTPGVSDPLYQLVQLAINNGIPVYPLPGPSAVLASLIVSGLPVDRFVFAGFLPRKKRRRKTMETLAQHSASVVLFESPQRIQKTLEEIAEVFGERQIAVTRELTKMHEEVIRGSVQEVIQQTKSKKWKGEITLVIAGATKIKSEGSN